MYFYECINFRDTFTPQFLSLEYSNCKEAKSKIRQKFQISFNKYWQISLPQDFVQRIKSFLKLASRGLPDLNLLVLLNL